MDELFARIWENLGGRVGGPMTFRLILQPLVASVLAIRAGLKDAREGRPAYFWAILTDADNRRELIRDGWKSVAKVFTLAMIIDVVYQLIVFKWVYPSEVLILAFLLACVPYLVIRGPVNRLASMFKRSTRR